MENHNRRVGIFQAEWSLTSQVVNCSICLAQAGYLVDLFLYNASEIVYELDQLKETPNVQVHVLDLIDTNQFNGSYEAAKPQGQPGGFYHYTKSLVTKAYYEVFRRLMNAHELYLLWRGSEKGLLPGPLLEKTYRLVEGKRYKCFIGVEKGGLIWAGQVAKRVRVPHIYYSLELYTRDHPVSRRTLRARRIKLGEEKYHRACYATIIQDPQRAKVLLKDNHVQQDILLYVPVSLMGGPYTMRSSFLQDRFHLGEKQVLILSLGQIDEKRFSLELARLSQDFPKEWVLVEHGLGSNVCIQRVRDIDVKHRVILSLETVPAARLHELVSSAHIGLALYWPSPMNDYLTAFSSEKLASYLQCGLPVITFDYPGYDVIEKRRCGVLIKTLEQLPQAVNAVLASYEEFSSNARACFAEHYEFSNNFRKVIDMINNLSENTH